MQDSLVFFSGWLRRPLRVGSITPSSPALGRWMARQIDRKLPGKVVELGGGTGAITEAILADGIAADDLIVVERDRTLHSHLVHTFPGVQVVRGHAGALRSIIEGPTGIPPVSTVISGLPLLAMPPAVRARILEESFACLQPGGTFIQFTYGLLCPVPGRILRKLGLKATPVRRIWLNLPPAAIWRFEKLT